MRKRIYRWGLRNVMLIRPHEVGRPTPAAVIEEALDWLLDAKGCDMSRQGSAHAFVRAFRKKF